MAVDMAKTLFSLNRAKSCLQVANFFILPEFRATGRSVFGEPRIDRLGEKGDNDGVIRSKLAEPSDAFPISRNGPLPGDPRWFHGSP